MSTQSFFRNGFLLIALGLSAGGGAAQNLTGAIEVRVLTLENRPVEGASVYWSEAGRPMGGRVIYKLTDADGFVTITGLEPAPYWVAGFKTEEGYPDPMFVFNATEHARRLVEVEAGRTSKATLRLGPKAARLKVRVLDSESGAELQGAKLWLEREGVPNSTLYFTGEKLELLVPAGIPVTLSIECEGYQRWTYKDPAEGRDTLVLTSGSEEAITARLNR